jgi:6-phosphofructokinase 2
MVLTLTINPCIDKSSKVEQLLPGSKLRCSEMVNEAGGGGINVSKALHSLETQATAVFPAGGHNGNMLTELLGRSGIKFDAVASGAETRENWVIWETSTSRQYRFTFPGLPLPEETVSGLLDKVSASHASFVVASGSLPQGLGDTFFMSVVQRAVASGAKCIVDSSGPAIQALKGKNAFLIKPNIGELSKMLGTGWLAEAEVPAAARRAVEEGFARIVVVSMGAAGAWGVSREESFFCKAPAVEVRSTVGAGDSMVAGMVFKLLQDAPLDELLRFGVACGTAATLNEGTQLFRKEDAYRLFGEMKP